MSRFSTLLQQVSDRLELPEQAKSRVLLEMAADLEDMYDACRQRGLSKEEAVRKAEEKFHASDDAMVELVRLHRSTLGSGMEKLSEQAATWWERLILGAVILFVVVSAGGLLLLPDFFSHAGGFAWPGVVLGLIAAVIFIAKAQKLFFGKMHRVRDLRKGLPALLFITCAALFNGLFGFFVTMQLTMFRIAEDYELTNQLFSRWLFESTSTMILSLLVSILAALFWFVLMNRVKRMEKSEAGRLLEEAA